ncbi:hypothetical protein CRE_25728 [Caenorhabditis remanei]|uniref:CCHC-type domain-containing protein n=1 Tax=Caenorhabditis remanei TaxID=31234 RepID=E3MLB6_CAERE|nr:hypothetical protein CRE_25728 [Caenorhabditis remanei]
MIPEIVFNSISPETEVSANTGRSTTSSKHVYTANKQKNSRQFKRFDTTSPFKHRDVRDLLKSAKRRLKRITDDQVRKHQWSETDVGLAPGDVGRRKTSENLKIQSFSGFSDAKISELARQSYSGNTTSKKEVAPEKFLIDLNPDSKSLVWLLDGCITSAGQPAPNAQLPTEPIASPTNIVIDYRDRVNQRDLSRNNRRRNHNGGGNEWSERKCYYCQKTGHYLRGCRQKREDRENGIITQRSNRDWNPRHNHQIDVNAVFRDDEVKALRDAIQARDEQIEELSKQLDRISQGSHYSTSESSTSEASHLRSTYDPPGESSADSLFHKALKLTMQSYHEYRKDPEYQNEVSLERLLERLNQAIKSLAIREAPSTTDQTPDTAREGEACLVPNQQPPEPTQLSTQLAASLANTATDHKDQDDCRDHRSERQGRDDDYGGRSSENDSQVSRREILLTFTGKCHYCGKVGHMARSHKLKQQSVANQQKSKDPVSNHQVIQVDAEEEASCLREMILWQDLRIHELKEWNDRLRRDNSSSTSGNQTSQADPPSAMALWTIFGQKNKFPRSKFNLV